MSKFRFRLQTLLRMNEAARDERREQLAEALRIEAMLKQQEAELERQRHEMRLQQTAPRGRVDVDRLIDGQRYEMVLQIERQKLAQQQQLLAQEIERRRADLVEADRQVKLLERYREKQQSRHNAAEALREQKQFDEIAGQRHQREVPQC